MNTKQKTKWWIDAVLFAGFIIAFFLDLTGVALHQWIGVLAGALAAYHLIVHREWVVAVTQRFFGRTSGRARLYYLIDGAILIGFASMIGTGLLISTWLSLSLANYEIWRVIHILASVATLLVVVLKLGLHWRWIALAARNTLSQPAPAQRKPAPLPAAPRAAGARGISRGEFLGVMGVVGLASFLALIPATASLTSLQSTASSSPSAPASNTSGTDSSSSSSGNSACSVSCGRRCSYPGHCRRYTDANQNGLCDFGECL